MGPDNPRRVTEPLSNDLRKFESRFSTFASPFLPSACAVTWILSILPFLLFVPSPYLFDE